MKNDIKKYLTLGAVLAGSAFMVSCDGDDVTVTETSLDTSGLEAAVTASNTKLPFNGLPSVFLPAARISAIVSNISIVDNTAGDNTCVWPCGDGQVVVINRGDEFSIDFESVNFADFYCGGSNHAVNGTQADPVGNTESINNLEVVGYTNDETAGAFSFSLKERDSNPDEIVFDQMTFTVGGKLDYTLFGTFTSGGTTCAEPNLNTENEHDLESAENSDAGYALTANTVNGTAIADTFVNDNATNEGNDIEITNDNNTTIGYRTQDNTILVRLATTATDDPVYMTILADGTTSINIGALETAIAGGIRTVTVAQLNGGATVAEGEWVQVCATATGCVIEGTFRADLNPSQGGIDQITVDGLIDDWLSENFQNHTDADGSTTNPGDLEDNDGVNDVNGNTIVQ